MGIDALLTDERGKIEAEVLDPLNRLSKLFIAIPELQSMCRIPYIDPYGDTVFDRLQVGRFLEEWVQVVNLASSADEKVQVTAIRALAIRCRDSAHLYLKFIGD
jgi:hypothetical protein